MLIMNFLTKAECAVPNWIMSYSHLVRPVRTTPPYSRTINRTKTLTFSCPNFANEKKYFLDCEYFLAKMILKCPLQTLESEVTVVQNDH